MQSASNRWFFLSVWHWVNRRPCKIIGHLFYAHWRFVYHFIAICDLKLELSSGNAEIEVKLVNFWLVWHWNWRNDLFYTTPSFVHHSVAIYEFKLSCGPEMPKMGQNVFWPLWPWPLTYCMDITFDYGNYCWNFHDDAMTGTCEKSVMDKKVDRDRAIHKAA